MRFEMGRILEVAWRIGSPPSFPDFGESHCHEASPAVARTAKDCPHELSNLTRDRPPPSPLGGSVLTTESATNSSAPLSAASGDRQSSSCAAALPLMRRQLPSSLRYTEDTLDPGRCAKYWFRVPEVDSRQVVYFHISETHNAFICFVVTSPWILQESQKSLRPGLPPRLRSSRKRRSSRSRARQPLRPVVRMLLGRASLPKT